MTSRAEPDPQAYQSYPEWGGSPQETQSRATEPARFTPYVDLLKQIQTSVGFPNPVLERALWIFRHSLNGSHQHKKPLLFACLITAARELNHPLDLKKARVFMSSRHAKRHIDRALFRLQEHAKEKPSSPSAVYDQARAEDLIERSSGLGSTGRGTAALRTGQQMQLALVVTSNPKVSVAQAVLKLVALTSQSNRITLSEITQIPEDTLQRAVKRLIHNCVLDNDGDGALTIHPQDNPETLDTIEIMSWAKDWIEVVRVLVLECLEKRFKTTSRDLIHLTRVRTEIRSRLPFLEISEYRNVLQEVIDDLCINGILRLIEGDVYRLSL